MDISTRPDGLQSREDSRDTSSSINATELFELAKASDQKKVDTIHKIDEVILDKVLRDKSPEAKAGRRKALIRAAYGEFMCSLLFYTPIFGTIINGHLNGYPGATMATLTAFVGGFQAIGVSFAFSSVSGAHFNSAISFALWLTGKLSNRRMVIYVLVQLLASIVAMGICAGMFVGNLHPAYVACTITPIDNTRLDKVFSTEFFLTFILTYVGFTVAFEDAERQKKESMSFKTISDSKGLTLYASTPQSKTGFAPFSIGLTIFSLTLISGGSGGAFNPGRMFGPAIFANKWDYLYLYWIAQLCGASAAALLVVNMHRFGLDFVSRDEVSAKDAVANLPGGQLTKAALKSAAKDGDDTHNPMGMNGASHDSIEV